MRLTRAEIFEPSEIVAVHAMARTNRRCFLLGKDHWLSSQMGAHEQP